MKKAISLLLALVIMLSAFMCMGVSAQAENADTLAVTVNGVTTNVAVGDTFTYTYSLTDLVLKNTEAVLYYDSDVLSVTKPADDEYDTLSAFKQSAFPIVYDSAYYNLDLQDKIKFNFSNIDNYRFVGEQTLATFEFTALSAGETTINMEIVAMVDSDNNYIVRKTTSGPVKEKDYTFGEYITYEMPEVPETEPPTEAPTEAPTPAPTEAPTQAPTQTPTQAPTEDTRGKTVQNIQVVSTSANTVSLSWDQLEDAFKYWVYRYDEATDNWVIMTRVTFTTEAVVKNLTPDTTYKFKVTAKFASDNFVTSLDDAVEFEATTGPAAAPAEIAATFDLDQFVLSWDEVEGATKYWLYKSTSPDGPFAINGSTRTNSIAVKKYYPETTYYFKVTSYTMQNGIPCISDLADSPIIEVTTPSASSVATKLETKTDTTATVSWPSVATASKYWVYYSTTTNDITDMSQWKLYNSETDMSVNTMTIKKLTPNTKYFVTVKVLYTNTSGEPKEYIYAPTGLLTTYSAGQFLTFTEVSDTHFSVTWPEDAAFEGKVWVWRYDADGNRTIVNSVTGANTLNVKKFDGYEDCYYELETFIATGMYGYLTPIGGEKYHAD